MAFFDLQGQFFWVRCLQRKLERGNKSNLDQIKATFGMDHRWLPKEDSRLLPFGKHDGADLLRKDMIGY